MTVQAALDLRTNPPSTDTLTLKADTSHAPSRAHSLQHIPPAVKFTRLTAQMEMAGRLARLSPFRIAIIV